MATLSLLSTNHCTHSSCSGFSSSMFDSVATTVRIALSSSSTAAIVGTTFHTNASWGGWSQATSFMFSNIFYGYKQIYIFNIYRTEVSFFNQLFDPS